MTARPGVTTWYLEMTDAAQLRPAKPVAGLEVQRIEPPDPELSAHLYDAVGGPWQWTDRLGWDERGSEDQASGRHAAPR